MAGAAVVAVVVTLTSGGKAAAAGVSAAATTFGTQMKRGVENIPRARVLPFAPKQTWHPPREGPAEIELKPQPPPPPHERRGGRVRVDPGIASGRKLGRPPPGWPSVTPGRARVGDGTWGARGPGTKFHRVEGCDGSEN